MASHLLHPKILLVIEPGSLIFSSHKRREKQRLWGDEGASLFLVIWGSAGHEIAPGVTSDHR